MSKMKNPFKKPTFSFEFHDESTAKRFYNFAMDTNATLVQFPFHPSGNCTRNKQKVLVTGIGNLVEDGILQSLLCEEAEKIGHFIFRAN